MTTMHLNIQESTTTVGVGNIILGGASNNGQTLSSKYPLNQEFIYIVGSDTEHEWGVGYLSDSTTLVRLDPRGGSSALPVNFSAGEKQVIIGANPSSLTSYGCGFTDLGSTLKFIVPSNYVRTNTTQALTADRLYHCPIYLSEDKVISALGCRVTTGQGTATNQLRLGISSRDPLSGLPRTLLTETAALDPSVATTVSGSVTPIHLQQGWYIAQVWSDVNPTLRASGGDIIMRNPSSTVNNPNLTTLTYWYTNSQSLSAGLPTVGNAALANTAGGNVPVVILGEL